MRMLLIASAFVVGLCLLIIAALYLGSLDWSRAHTRAVSALPQYSNAAPDGEYQIAAAGMRFRARVYGTRNSGDWVIMLHGFPESSLAWDDLAREAAAAGFRVLAFDQRGYSPGARPTGVAQYQIRKLVSDVLALADAVGAERFHLIGHDWGAAVGWTVVADHSERVISWVGLSIPQTAVFMDAVVNDPQQRAKSQYFEFNRLPFVPEFYATYAGQRNMRRLLANVPEHLRGEYLAILAEPGAMTATLHWYRAMDTLMLAQDPALNRPVTTPTLFLWGEHDGVISEGPILRQAARMEGPYQSIRLDAGHGLLREARSAVGDAILQHLRTYSIVVARAEEPSPSR